MSSKKNSSSQNETTVSRFEASCPLKLKKFPDGICEHGLTRARWMSDHSGYLAFEEKTARGCPFGMLTEDKHGYCFFKMMADMDRPLSEEEIAKLLCLSRDQVKKIVDTASIKLKGKSEISSLKSLHEEGFLFEDESIDDDIYFPDYVSEESDSLDSASQADPTH